ncbi:MAG: 3'-5' exoribonuclease, partial [Thermoproteota archaeon]
MDDRVKIADLKVKDELENTYFVKYIQVMESRDGKNYLNVILGDSTGDLEGRVWQKAREIADRVEKGNYVKAKGRVNLFQGRKQFIISKIESVDEAEINPSDYISTSEESPDLMFTRLTEIITGLKDVYIRELLIAVINDQEIARRLKTWQAGKTIHHAYQSGLLEHILSCCELGLTLSPIYKVNTSYVIAGCFLHDLCKIYELTDGANVEYTEEGKLVGHLVKSLEIVDRFSYRIPNFPYKLKLHLKHILLSHHGQYEYGSPKIPQTSEAMLVHMIDLMDSKMATF